MKGRLSLIAVVVALGGLVAAVASAASSPSVVTGGATDITTSSALLHGSVNPNGTSTTYYFQWGLTTSYGVPSHASSAGRGTHSISVKASATGLIPGTTYHYQLVAVNKDGTSTGTDHSFTTAGHPPPNVATGPATNITRFSATLTGTVNPNGENTSYTFQYGTTTAYGVETFTQNVPAGTTPQAVSVTLTGLEPGTMFYYRLVGLHGTSVVQYGLPQSFMTYPSPRPVPRISIRTKPHRAKTAPYTFTTTGKVIGPSSIPPSLACVGNATLRFFAGKKQVAFSLLPINPDCTFSDQTTFNHLPAPGGRRHQVALRVLLHFRGNGYLAPSDARIERVLAG